MISKIRKWLFCNHLPILYFFLLLIHFPSLMAQPIISSLDPKGGSTGSTEIIKGSGFNLTSSSNIAYWRTKENCICTNSRDTSAIVPTNT